MNRKYQRTGYVWMLCVLMIAPALAQVQQRNNDEQRPDPRQQVNDRLREMLADVREVREVRNAGKG